MPPGAGERPVHSTQVPAGPQPMSGAASVHNPAAAPPAGTFPEQQARQYTVARDKQIVFDHRRRGTFRKTPGKRSGGGGDDDLVTVESFLLVMLALDGREEESERGGGGSRLVYTDCGGSLDQLLRECGISRGWGRDRLDRLRALGHILSLGNGRYEIVHRRDPRPRQTIEGELPFDQSCPRDKSRPQDSLSPAGGTSKSPDQSCPQDSQSRRQDFSPVAGAAAADFSPRQSCRQDFAADHDHTQTLSKTENEKDHDPLPPDPLDPPLDRAAAEKRLGSIVLGGRKLTPGMIDKLLRDCPQNCTAAIIQMAEEITRFQLEKHRRRGDPIRPDRYLFGCIQRRCVPPNHGKFADRPDDLPEHVQEDQALAEERGRRLEAEVRQQMKVLAEFSDRQLAPVVSAVAVTEPDADLRKLYVAVKPADLRDERKWPDLRRKVIARLLEKGQRAE